MDHTHFNRLEDSVTLKKPVISRRKLIIWGAIVGIVTLVVGLVIFAVILQTENSPPRPVETVECYGYGYKFVDNPDVCVCFACRKGPDCGLSIENCTADLASGQPIIMQDYWKAHVSTATVSDIPPYFKTLYGDRVPQLEDTIRALHHMVGNANPDNKTIIFGYGGTSLLNAAINAVNYVNGQPIPLFSLAPHYTYGDFVGYNPALGVFNDSIYQDASNLVEVVTTPNNPTCYLREPYFPDAKYHIYDMVYYWPTYTNISKTYNEDIMIFSASKCTGHAANRFGWALVKDRNVASRMTQYIQMNNFGYSTDLQQKFNLLYKDVIASQGEIFNYGKQKLAQRYTTLLQILQNQTEPPRFSLESQVGGFYLWLKCNHASDQDCSSVFRSALVVGRSGTVYGVGKEYIRISFMARDHEIEEFFTYLQDLIHHPEKRHTRNIEDRYVEPEFRVGC